MNETNTNNPNHPEPVPDKPDYAFEDRRSRARRKDMGILRPSNHDDTNWALGLSGGGIRSATFCLGALQGMEKTTPTGATDATGTSTESSMLRQFDYVSTVSGGGYIGSFFSSLFIPERLDPPTAPAQTTATITAAGKVALSNKETADQAYRVFTEEPPARLRWETEYDPARPGRTALAWLRENGRYLIPSGAGDLTYAIAIHVRNWCATHYVLGTVLFTLFALLAAVRATILYFGISTEQEWISAYAAYEQSQLSGVLNHIRPPFSMDSIWWSPVWWLLLPLLAIWVLPCGLAFWLTHPDKGKTVAEPAKAWTEAVYVCLFLSVLLFCFSLAIYGYVPQWRPLAYLLGAGGLLTALGFVWHHLSLTNGTTVAAQRVTLTRGLSKGFICFGLVAAVAFLDTCAQTLYVQSGNIWHKLSPAAAAGILIWIARHLASLTDERKGPSWLSKIPLDVMAGIAGVVLACLVAVMWAMAVIWVQWDGALPSTDALKSQDAYRLHLAAAWFALGLGLTLALTTGMFPGFLNLSTLQGLYSSRITRAYLGASNSKRFTQTDVKEKRRLRSAAEPAPDDNVDLADIYKNPYAPMHIINTCMNLTSDPAEQLVQRDRKGMPLAVVPGGLSYSDKLFSMPVADDKSEADAKMTVGEWVGVSGAAFTTGLGRSTSLGFSLLLGLANVRLGRWWASGIYRNHLEVRDIGMRRWFRTQFYLIDEFLARFHGMRREMQYLSDGGHFENTALYELLREERDIRLMVVCDCGADPKYEFADLANLTRLARIDFRIELEEDIGAATHPELGKVFGRTVDFKPDAHGKSPRHDKCAILLNLYRAKNVPLAADAQKTSTPDARIILLKPRVLSNSAADLVEYQVTHPAFPQEPTADQFFDEAQWESYRRLGREIAMRVFPGPGSSAEYRKAFVDGVLGRVPLPETMHATKPTIAAS